MPGSRSGGPVNRSNGQRRGATIAPVHETHRVVIIGAGPSGLSVGRSLAERGVPAVILERASAVGPAWRNHYERLHLHTVKKHSTLPYHAWPDHVPLYPSRAEVVDYLESYAKRIEPMIRLDQNVTSARHEGGKWVVRTQSAELHTANLIVATGYNRRPNKPTWTGQETFRGSILHSSEYRTGKTWKGKRALVVGIGNSGGEIAIDLWEQGALETAIAVRSPLHILPRDLFGTPAQVTAILTSRLPTALVDRITLALLDRLQGDLSKWGLRRPAEGPMTSLAKYGRVPLLDIGTVELIQQGHIDVVPGIERFTEERVVFSDGRERAFDVVVLATGYQAALNEFLDDAARHVTDRGYPKRFGQEAETPGLFFIGYRNPGIGQLNDISKEAVRVAAAIAEKPHG